MRLGESDLCRTRPMRFEGRPTLSRCSTHSSTESMQELDRVGLFTRKISLSLYSRAFAVIHKLNSIFSRRLDTSREACYVGNLGFVSDGVLSRTVETYN